MMKESNTWYKYKTNNWKIRVKSKGELEIAKFVSPNDILYKPNHIKKAKPWLNTIVPIKVIGKKKIDWERI
ncbi:MAG: hypothetical protein ACE5R6_14470 [Candidatus Heimdallarchaeota archaeon]